MEFKLIFAILVLIFYGVIANPVETREDSASPMYGGDEHPDLSKDEGPPAVFNLPDVIPKGPDDENEENKVPSPLETNEVIPPDLIGGAEDVDIPPPEGEGGADHAPPGIDIGDPAVSPNEDTEEGEQPPVFINGVGEMNCFPASQNIAAFYGTCEVKEVTPDCYDVKCPPDYQECSNNGTKYKMGSDEEWTETRNEKPHICTCVWPGAIYWSMPARPMGAPDFSAIKNCDLAGCEGPNNEFMVEGDEVTIGDETCRCVAGTDPMLMDASTRYHLSCPREPDTQIPSMDNPMQLPAEIPERLPEKEENEPEANIPEPIAN